MLSRVIVLRDGCVLFNDDVVLCKSDVTDDVTDDEDEEELCET